MAEIAGLALGSVGLASLFTTCIDCFNMVQLGRAKDRDFLILHQKLDNQKARFINWGESIYLDDTTRQCLLDARPQVRDSAANTMKLVASMFRESHRLTTRYGLKVETQPGALVAPADNQWSALRHVFQRIERKTRPGRAGLQTPTKLLYWVITDRARFEDLVKDLRELIDDLESLTTSAEAIARRHQIVASDIELVPEEALPIMEEAGEDTRDAISDAASVRLESIERHTLSSNNSTSLHGSFWTDPEYQRSKRFSNLVDPETHATKANYKRGKPSTIWLNGVLPWSPFDTASYIPRTDSVDSLFELADASFEIERLDFWKVEKALALVKSTSFARTHTRTQIVNFKKDSFMGWPVSFCPINYNSLDLIGCLCCSSSAVEPGTVFVHLQYPDNYPLWHISIALIHSTEGRLEEYPIPEGVWQKLNLTSVLALEIFDNLRQTVMTGGDGEAAQMIAKCIVRREEDLRTILYNFLTTYRRS